MISHFRSNSGARTLLGLFLVGIVQACGILISSTAEELTYTCSMHPQIRSPSPGRCPICGMPLVPIGPLPDTTPDTGARTTIALSDDARRMASVESVPVERRPLSHRVRAVGKIAYDETSLATITARVDGYAERLFVNVTGIEVNEGDHLVEIYSPELVVAQQELLVAAGVTGSPLLISTIIKLRRLGLTQGQISELLERRKVLERITLLSPIRGTVVARNITQSGAFTSGDVLYEIADLSTVWGYLEIYESQLPWLRYGQSVTMTSEALPGKTLSGKVTFISPVVNETTRTINVPVHIENRDHALKPGMFVSATIFVALDSQGAPAATGAEGLSTCPMHPQVIQSSEGSCPVCGMDLKRVPGAKSESGTPEVIAVPFSAVLDAGERQVVYVEVSPGLFESREVTVGPRAGEFFPVLKGLSVGERVAIRGGFLLDSQAQLSGARSLFSPHGASASANPHPAHSHDQMPEQEVAPRSSPRPEEQRH